LLPSPLHEAGVLAQGARLSRAGLGVLLRGGKRSEGQELAWVSCTKRREIAHNLCTKWCLFQCAKKAVFEGKIKFSGQYKIPWERRAEAASRYCDDGNEHVLKLWIQAASHQGKSRFSSTIVSSV